MEPDSPMTSSPLDRNAGPAPVEPPLAQLRYTPGKRWVPSKFNARTVDDGDGRLMIWNTLTGGISEFLPQHRDAALALLSPEGTADAADPLAKHLIARGFLVPAGTDEDARFRMMFGHQHWRSDTLQLILLASEDCNFRCVYCYEKFKQGTMRPEVRRGVRALVERRVPQLRSMTVNWFGGEPLYGWEAIEELAPFFRDVARTNGFGLVQDMTTNGYLLTEERATRLLDWGCNQYQITIDGLAEDHDCKRVGRDGSPTYDVILDNLRSLRQRKAQFGVTIRVNFDQQNFLKLGPFLEALSEDFGGDPRFRLRFRSVGKWGGLNDDDLETCGVKDVRWVNDELRRQAVELGLHPEGGIEDLRFIGSQVCYAARPFNFVVGATGKLMKCTIVLDEMEENVVGRLTPEGNVELDDLRFARWVTPHFETDELCGSCYVLPGCQGAACPLTRIQSGERTCCGVKSELKREMRFSLAATARARAAGAPPA